jgi:hypothetical protein
LQLSGRHIGELAADLTMLFALWQPHLLRLIILYEYFGFLHLLFCLDYLDRVYASIMSIG